MTRSGPETTLKRLQTQRDQAKARLEQALEGQRDAAENLQRARGKLRRLDDEIANLAELSKDPIVTEHAQLRFLERIRGLDLRQVKEDILCPKVAEAIAKLGSGSFPGQLPDGTWFMAKVKNRTVITVLPYPRDKD